MTFDRLADSAALHARVRSFILAFTKAEVAAESFDAIAADVARFQAKYVPGYARLCIARGVHAAKMTSAAEAPAVPTEAFKLARVFAFEESEAEVTFRTSGTTASARGVHRMRDVGTYEAASLSFGRSMLARGLDERTSVLVLGPSPAEAPDSSLGHMCGAFSRELVGRETKSPYFVERGRIRRELLAARIAELPHSAPAIVLATSFALVHLIDEVSRTEAPGQASAFVLPRGSRVMQTGGFKGRSREVSAPDLRRGVSDLFGIPERSIVNEYGMTELSSQFWEATLLGDLWPPGVFLEPPWARVVVVHPDTLAPVPEGEVGIARIEDLANVDSAFAVVAADRVRRVRGGFELLGRASGAAPRGCSIAMDEILSATDDPT